MIERTPSRVWFITGAGRGFGRQFTQAALAAGDRVVATARRPEALGDLAAEHGERLVVLPLDVTDRAAVFATVDRAVAAFGRLDIVVNNAGYGVGGTVEEVTEAQARGILDTNFFGALWVTQAVTPVLRGQRSGHIVQVSSVNVLLGVPTMGLYAASKAAMEGMSDALAAELAPFGVRVTMLEPSVYGTEFITGMQFAAPNEAYQPVREALMKQYGAAPTAGDPARVAAALLEVVASPTPPRRLVLGVEYDAVVDAYRRRMEESSAWERVSRAG
jgi:NAD(P)-dependent dehydrogenase (short-subunit alcohol dehydrogenase family)